MVDGRQGGRSERRALVVMNDWPWRKFHSIYVRVFVHLLCQHVQPCMHHFPKLSLSPISVSPEPCHPTLAVSSSSSPSSSSTCDDDGGALSPSHPPHMTMTPALTSPLPTSFLHTRRCRRVALVPSLHMRQRCQWRLALASSSLTHRTVTQARRGCCDHPAEMETMTDPARPLENPADVAGDDKHHPDGPTERPNKQGGEMAGRGYRKSCRVRWRC